jgi:hypothetical protein
VRTRWNRVTSIDNLRARNACKVIVTPLGEIIGETECAPQLL